MRRRAYAIRVGSLSFMHFHRSIACRSADSLFGQRGLDGNWRAWHIRRPDPAPQDLGNAPRLGDASAWRVWLLRIEDLTDRPETELVELWYERIEKTPRADDVVRMYLEPRVDPRTDEPRPNGSLMVSGISRA